MDEKSAKPKRMGNHYIPPPARKQGFETNEGTRHKERPMKTCENRGVKLCNDSSLLFKESHDKVKEKTRRSRRSKRTAMKADAENAVESGNQVSEPKSSSPASGLTDRIINFQSDQSIDSSVLLERPKATVVIPTVYLENMELRHPVELTSTDGPGEGVEHKEVLKHHHSDQDITNVPQVVKTQLKTLKMFPPSDQGNRDIVGNKYEPRDDVKFDLCHHDDIKKTPEKLENPSSSLELLKSSELVITDRIGEESRMTTMKCDAAGEEFKSYEPAFIIVEEDSLNLCSELCDSLWTSSQDSIENCDETNSNNGSNYSSSLTKIECLKPSDSSAIPESTKWLETSLNSHLHTVDDADWESIYDDRGECLLPSAGSANLYSSEVVKNSVQVKASDNKKEDDDQPHETSSIIEIYGFSEDLKTNDILNAFGNWNQRGFNLKWVDNTHALGIFPTPALAEEVLSSNIPIVKIRPISQGTTLSQERARTLVLPSSLRPKTCTALARRLVSGALGLRVNVTPEERAAERELLREAREKKKLVLKQRDAAWEGTFSPLESSEEKASN